MLGLVTSLTVAKDMQKVLCTPSYISIVTCIGVYYITIGGAYIINEADESQDIALNVQSVTFSWKRIKERRGGVTKS